MKHWSACPLCGSIRQQQTGSRALRTYLFVFSRQRSSASEMWKKRNKVVCFFDNYYQILLTSLDDSGCCWQFMLLQSWLPSFKEVRYASLTLCGRVRLVSSVVPKLSLKSFPSHHRTNGQVSWLFSLLISLLKYEMLTAEVFSHLKNTTKTISWKQNSDLSPMQLTYLKEWCGPAWEQGNMQLDWARGIYILPSASLNSWILHCSDLALERPASLPHC